MGNTPSPAFPGLLLPIRAERERTAMFNWIDWLMFGIIAVSGVIGIWRGLIKELLTAANIIIAVVVAVTFREKLAMLWVDQITSTAVREFAAFLTLFIAVLIVGGLVSFVIGKLVRLTALNPLDRMLGLIFGLGRGIAAVMAALLLFAPSVPDDTAWWRESVLIPYFLVHEERARASVSHLVSWATTLPGKS